MRYGPGDAVGDVCGQRPDDSADQRCERAADGQQQMDERGNGLVLWMGRLMRLIIVMVTMTAGVVVRLRFAAARTTRNGRRRRYRRRRVRGKLYPVVSR